MIWAVDVFLGTLAMQVINYMQELRALEVLSAPHKTCMQYTRTILSMLVHS